jgi:hypothetical protein
VPPLKSAWPSPSSSLPSSGAAPGLSSPPCIGRSFPSTLIPSQIHPSQRLQNGSRWHHVVAHRTSANTSLCYMCYRFYMSWGWCIATFAPSTSQFHLARIVTCSTSASVSLFHVDKTRFLRLRDHWKQRRWRFWGRLPTRILNPILTFLWLVRTM